MCRYVDWINLGQVMRKSQAVVNRVMNIQGPKNAGNFLTTRYPGLVKKD